MSSDLNSSSDSEHASLARLRHHFNGGLTKDLAWRDQQLAQLCALLKDHEVQIAQALAKDLDKPVQEVFLGELALLYSEIKYARKHLKAWARPRRVPTPLVGRPGGSHVVPEPRGVVLIIGAWNYPIQLILGPLIPAMAAGNAAILKPSEVAQETAKLVADLVPAYLDDRAFAVINGGVETTTELLAQRFDHIFYTGGGAVGKIVMSAAARHLTPVTLELGGKSPCLVDDTADIRSAARRIIWGKCLNAGQTCIAPDYVLVTSKQKAPLIGAIRDELDRMYGEDRLASQDYCKIINERHFDRLLANLGDGNIVIGGRSDRDRLRIEPTVMTDIPPGAPILTEEIFGPLLPIVEISDLQHGIDYIKDGDKPLAAYLFSTDQSHHQQFTDSVSAGNMCINDVLMFMSVPELPFGGVGGSGMGQYHGRAGFDQLSHLKAVMKRGRFPETWVRFAPYSTLKTRLLKLFG
mgnify:CR=1 FL=1